MATQVTILLVAQIAVTALSKKIGLPLVITSAMLATKTVTTTVSILAQIWHTAEAATKFVGVVSALVENATTVRI